MRILPKEERTGLLCECGRRKEESRFECCNECEFLDGGRDVHSETIELLRNHDMSCTEIAKASGRWRDAVQRSLGLLVKQGRVARYWREGECRETESKRHQFVSKMRTGATSCWVYTLTDRRKVA